jgi:hypothetical protein
LRWKVVVGAILFAARLIVANPEQSDAVPVCLFVSNPEQARLLADRCIGQGAYRRAAECYRTPLTADAG